MPSDTTAGQMNGAPNKPRQGKPRQAEPQQTEPEQFYAEHQKIYPQSVKGPFRRIKWALLVACLGVYYFLPFLRWDRGPGQPDQAVLIDFSTRRFYVFFIEIWPQEVYYIAGLMILAAMALFLMNAIAGRVWCGYLCPQTVWTDLFLLTERWFEGDRRTRMKRDAAPWTADKIARKIGKHISWLLIAWWTGGAWVLYFADAPTLVRDLFFLRAPLTAYAWIGLLTFTTYTLAGMMREQICIYMCPWPRIQAALTDEWALNVAYRTDRGEPRMSLKSAQAARAAGAPAGDCIDCNQCVVVCPTGTDIRLGSQMSCIQCGLCIDACNSVMDKIKRPQGLIAYDTDVNMARRKEGKPPVRHLVRARSLLYVALIVGIGGIMLYSLMTRTTLAVDVLHDRNPQYVVNSNGGIRNGYTVRILNKASTTRSFELTVDGLPEPSRLEVLGEAVTGGTTATVMVDGDQTRELRVLVFAPPGEKVPASSDVIFRIRDLAGGNAAVHRDFFKAP